MRHWSLIRIECCPWRSAESISSRFPGGARDMQHIELSLCLFLDPAEPLHESAGPDRLGGAVAKRSDHAGGYSAESITSSV
jgi:hypothetical protein